MPYGIFEATNIKGRNLSFVSTVDIENGQLFHRGELVTGSKDIYNAVLPTAESLATTPVLILLGIMPITVLLTRTKMPILSPRENLSVLTRLATQRMFLTNTLLPIIRLIFLVLMVRPK